MIGTPRLVNLGAVIIGALSALLLSAAPPVQAQTETVLYSFCSQAGCTDGEQPYSKLVMGKKGNLYGTTYGGGANGYGTAFEVSRKGAETVLHSFSNGDGSSPEDYGGVVLDKMGNVYATASLGSPNRGGTIVEISPNGTETVLYEFCSQQQCVDGFNAIAGLIFDKVNGSLYGTTNSGGANGVGTVFEVNPNGAVTFLHSFNYSDGGYPFAPVVLGKKGKLYGTTFYGGTNDGGTVFEVSPNGTETVLYNFCSQPGCADGIETISGLVLDKLGNLYGSTAGGGSNGAGTVFELSPGGAYTVLHNFANDGIDGNLPTGLIFDKKGNLYGTTVYGGANNQGTVFEISPNGAETVLYSFCSQLDCTDGAQPFDGLILDGKGNLYGTTYSGGANNQGTVFKVTP